MYDAILYSDNLTSTSRTRQRRAAIGRWSLAVRPRLIRTTSLQIGTPDHAAPPTAVHVGVLVAQSDDLAAGSLRCTAACGGTCHADEIAASIAWRPRDGRGAQRQLAGVLGTIVRARPRRRSPGTRCGLQGARRIVGRLRPRCILRPRRPATSPFYLVPITASARCRHHPTGVAAAALIHGGLAKSAVAPAWAPAAADQDAYLQAMVAESVSRLDLSGVSRNLTPARASSSRFGADMADGAPRERSPKSTRAASRSTSRTARGCAGARS